MRYVPEEKKYAMAYAALGGLKHFFKSNAEATDISNATFTFAKFVLFNHTPTIVVKLLNFPRLTTAVLIGCSILTTSKQFFGDPIHCHKDSPVLSLQVLLLCINLSRERLCFLVSSCTSKTCPGLWVLLLHGGDLHPSCQEELLIWKRHHVVRLHCWPWSWPPRSGARLPQLLSVGSSCACTAGCFLLSSMVSHY